MSEAASWMIFQDHRQILVSASIVKLTDSEPLMRVRRTFRMGKQDSAHYAAVIFTLEVLVNGR
jgi:hypothetical protein